MDNLYFLSLSTPRCVSSPALHQAPAMIPDRETRSLRRLMPSISLKKVLSSIEPEQPFVPWRVPSVSIFTEISAASATIQSPPLIDVVT